MQKFVAAGIAMLFGSAAFAADSYTIDSRHTFPSFEVNHLGFSTQRGRFNVTKGKVTLDRTTKSGSIEITIDTASISTGLDKLEEHLRSPDFLNAAAFPTMTFKSSKITFNGDAITSVDGDITLMGITKPLTLSVARFRCAIHPMLKKEICGGDASGTFKRSDFGIKYGVPAIGDEVKLLIQVEAVKD